MQDSWLILSDIKGDKHVHHVMIITCITAGMTQDKFIVINKPDYQYILYRLNDLNAWTIVYRAYMYVINLFFVQVMYARKYLFYWQCYIIKHKY